MVGAWNDFERTFAAMDELRRKVQEALDSSAQWNGEAGAFSRAPAMNLWDAGGQLVLKADVPGVAEDDINVQLTQDVLTVSGQRRLSNPEGYSVHRQERTPLQFSRSFTLPCQVNGDAIAASLKDGVLTVTLPKAPESRPRQITVKAA
jgi:HSP20 family protein